MQMRTMVVDSHARASSMAPVSLDCQRSQVSCTASSASAEDESIRYAMPIRKGRCRSNSSPAIGRTSGRFLERVKVSHRALDEIARPNVTLAGELTPFHQSLSRQGRLHRLLAD